MNGDHHPVGRPSGESGRAKIDYAELRQRAENTSRGKWSYLREPGMVVCTLGRATPVPVFLRGSMAKHEDGQFAVAAQPSTVLALLDRIEELEGAVRDIAEATDPDNAESYRCDDREGCLDTVNAIAKALSGEKP